MKIMRVVALLALTSAVACWTADAQTLGEGVTVSKDNRTIAVTATDSVAVTADVATVIVGFVVYGVDHDSAYADGSKTSNAIMDALKKAGVPSDAIESRNQSLSEVQVYQQNQLTEAEKAKRKWALTQSWAVRSNASDAARVLDVAVKAGANQSGQIVWNLKDENAPQAQAAEKALQRARAVAEVMAKGLNVKLGALLFASNQAPASPMGIGMGMAGAGLGGTIENAGYIELPPLAISPTRITKTATVYAVFAIE
ncbi:MAG: SIMPL domain-containing protein [Acidobacteriaceae bacterium]